MSSNRRKFFLGLSAAAAAASFRPSQVGQVHAADSPLVPLSKDLDPIVRQFEAVERGKAIELAAQLVRKGLSYRQFLAALFLAGIRNVRPQPPGFKFHCVFVCHAAHQLSLDAPRGDRLLPLFWVLDDFKRSQQKDVEEGDFRLGPLSDKLPSAGKAWSEFHSAMDAWDQPRAERAIAVLVRSRGALEVIEGLWRYGARDYRNIGHKPIFVANAWRVLQTIGWRHAEPVLRSLVLGLLDYGPTKKVNAFGFDDQCYRENRVHAQRATEKLPGDWQTRTGEAAVATGLLETIRSANAKSACRSALELLQSGKCGAQRVWDAVHLAAGELMMRQPGIYGIHTVTSANALRYAYESAASPQTRLLMTLQGVGWMCQFTRFMKGVRKGLNPRRITDLKPDPAGYVAAPLERSLGLTGVDSVKAADLAFTYAARNGSLPTFATRARQLVIRKSNEVHGYKYPVAIFEDLERVSSEFRPHLLATAVYYLRGSKQADSPVIAQAREALRG